MIERIFPAPLYTFLDYMNDIRIDKAILDCGVGGQFPKIALFSQFHYKLNGIEISEERLQWAKNFCKNHHIKANLIQGDMRDLPYDPEMFGFVYSYNTIFHMSKEDIRLSIEEMFRVLKKGGLLYLNLLSVDDSIYRVGEEINPGMYRQIIDNEYIEHTFFEFDEGDIFFDGHEILYKQIRKEYIKDDDYISGMVDYIVKK